MVENNGRPNGRKPAANDEDSVMVCLFPLPQHDGRLGTTLAEKGLRDRNPKSVH